MTELAEKMGFTKMTASRALNDLYHVNLLTYELMEILESIFLQRAEA